MYILIGLTTTKRYKYKNFKCNCFVFSSRTLDNLTSCIIRKLI